MMSRYSKENPEKKTSAAMEKALTLAENAESGHSTPVQAQVNALLALFWLKVVELEAQGVKIPEKP
jgi:hypothetical protein